MLVVSIFARWALLLPERVLIRIVPKRVPEKSIKRVPIFRNTISKTRARSKFTSEP